MGSVRRIGTAARRRASIDMPDWMTVPLDAAILVPLLMTLVRAVGLRSFAKMSAHDFAVTVATGSILAPRC